MDIKTSIKYPASSIPSILLGENPVSSIQYLKSQLPIFQTSDFGNQIIDSAESKALSVKFSTQKPASSIKHPISEIATSHLPNFGFTIVDYEILKSKIIHPKILHSFNPRPELRRRAANFLNFLSS